MSPVLRPCLDCGQPFEPRRGVARCPLHQAKYVRTRDRPLQSPAWMQLRAEKLEANPTARTAPLEACRYRRSRYSTSIRAQWVGRSCHRCPACARCVRHATPSGRDASSTSAIARLHRLHRTTNLTTGHGSHELQLRAPGGVEADSWPAISRRCVSATIRITHFSRFRAGLRRHG